MTDPLVSVILPVYNGAETLRASIACVLDQTFRDFELIILDDGSKDSSPEVIASFDDPRIRAYRHDNRGLAATLNRGIELARGTYLARQDQDDLSLPTRFEKQVAHLEAHPNCALLGTRAAIWVGDTPTDRAHDHPLDDAALRFDLMFDNPFVHSSVMLRRSAVIAVGGYATEHERQPEDYELWSRLARRWKVANLAEKLVIYREMPSSMTRTTSYTGRVVRIASENLAAEAGLPGPNAHTTDITSISHRFFEGLSQRPDMRAMEAVLHRAAHAIHAAAPESDVLQRLDVRLQNLRHHCPPHLRTPEMKFERFKRRMKRLFRIRR